MTMVSGYIPVPLVPFPLAQLKSTAGTDLPPILPLKPVKLLSMPEVQRVILENQDLEVDSL